MNRRAEKLQITAIIVLLILHSAYSIEVLCQPTQSDLNTIIDALQKKYSRMSGLSADFAQVYQSADGRTKRESGHVILKRPGKARWEYSSPERKTFVSDGKNIYFHVAGEPQATRTSIKESGDPQIPFLFLLGRGDLRKEFTRIELLNDERALENGNKVLRLVPKSAPEEFKRLVVEVSPTTFQVKRLIIFERSGARMDFILSNTRENYIAPDRVFQFSAPAGVTIKQR